MPAAGGRHVFAVGEVLTSANAQNFLMDQSVMYFATAATRTAGITTPTAGMVTFRADGNSGAGIIEYYTGATWQAVSSGSTALSINAQTGTTYTPVLGDANNLITLNNASAIAATIPTNTSVAFPIGTQLNFAWITGAGQPTISAVTPGTTTILSTGATSASPKIRVVNGMATAIKLLTDTWIITGDIS